MTWRHCHLVEPDVNTSTLSTALSTVSLFGLPVGDLKAENAGSGAKESQSTPCFTSWSIACVSYFVCLNLLDRIQNHVRINTQQFNFMCLVRILRKSHLIQLSIFRFSVLWYCKKKDLQVLERGIFTMLQAWRSSIYVGKGLQLWLPSNRKETKKILLRSTPWKINMEPTNHPFRRENYLPNLHNYFVPC